MAMKARYTVIDGEVIAEKRNGVRSLYVPDPLGSTAALLDNTEAQSDTFSYWPYGENNGRTGATATPFQFVGTAGYYRDSSTRTYVRARTLDSCTGRWINPDPIGLAGGLNRFMYCWDNGVSNVDYGGNYPAQIINPNRPPVFRPPTHGPFVDLLCVDRQKQLAEDIITLRYGTLAGPHNGFQDAFRHCLWACLVLKNCGAGPYNSGVIDHENPGAWWNPRANWDPFESPMDLANDERGRKCAVRNPKGLCEKECMKDLTKGDLYVLPKGRIRPGTGQPFW